MNENNEQNDLFSDDYEAPKRENPDSKKNREKAKAEKPPKEDKPARTGRVVESHESSAEEGYTHKRTFSDWMFEHVKLIAAISTVLVILALVLITDVVDVVTDLVTQTQQAEKENLTLNYVRGLTKKAEPIMWDDLDKFRRDETKAKDSVTWMLSVKGTDYELWISGVSTDKAPSYVYLYHMGTGDRLVIGEEDLDTFLEEHS